MKEKGSDPLKSHGLRCKNDDAETHNMLVLVFSIYNLVNVSFLLLIVSV